MTVQTTTRTHSQRRFDRGSWLTLGFVLSFTALCATLSAFILALPGDGCQLDATTDSPQPFQGCFGDWPTPLRPGDIVLSVNGWSATDVDSFGLVRRPPPPDWTTRSEAIYVVQRDGAAATRVVPLGRLGAASVLRVFGAALIRQLGSFLPPVFLGALVVFLLAPRAGAARLLLISSGGLFAVITFVLSAFTVATQFRSVPAWALEISIFLALIWGWLFIPCALLLVLSFPRRVWPLTRWPRAISVLIFGLPMVGTAFALLTGDLGPYGALLSLGALAVVAGGIAITLHTFLRVRDPVVRAQTAWMTLGLVAGFGFWPLSDMLPMPGLQEAYDRLPQLRGLLLFSIGLIFPLSMGIAITRYRLFDIEIIIRRTLVYSALTLTLALVYLGCIVLLQALVVPLLGGSELAIVASTLAIAALFNPLRRRIQTIIDKRFYRRKYDAAKVLAAFGATARDETNLDTLTVELLRVMDTTMRPEFVGLWLREKQAGSSFEDRG
jgi:hypothetical protein